MAPRTLLVVNPAAGGGRAGLALDRVLRELAPWRPFDVAVTQPGEPSPAEHVVRQAVLDGYERIAVLGGDGTASQAVNGLLAAGDAHGPLAPVVLALLPAGTGRDFARSAGIPRDPVLAARHVTHGAVVRAVDVGAVRWPPSAEHPGGRQRLFLNVASFGVGARIAHGLERRPTLKRRAGAVAFGIATVRAGLDHAPDHVETRIDDGAPERGPSAAMAIANGGWFGGGMRVAPGAAIDDGLLEIVHFGDLARRDFVLSLPMLYRGTHYAHPKVRHARGVAVMAAPVGGGRPVAIEADGEVVGHLPASFAVRPGELRLLG